MRWHGSPAGNLLRARLDDFMQAHPEIVVDVRVKSSSGPGSLLEALTSTNAAAPAAVPGLIALNRSDLEAAANDVRDKVAGAGNGHGRDQAEKFGKFVNGHDARDGRDAP